MDSYNNNAIGMKIGHGDGSFDSYFEMYDAINNLARRMDFNIEQRNGQRLFGPPKMWGDAPPPAKECEVFIGSIPHNVFEDELIPILLLAGNLYQLRLMLDYNSENRGFAFAMYTDPDEAARACNLFNNYEIKPGHKIGIIKSIDNTGIYIGPIVNRSPKQILTRAFLCISGVSSVVITKPDYKNRRYATVSYNTHREAALARRKLYVMAHRFWDNDHPICIDWMIRHTLPLPVIINIIPIRTFLSF